VAGPHSVQYEAHRPAIAGRNGMVASGHPLASQAGISTLQRGGNAVDAALAVASALNVVEPAMSGVGGDGFIMIYWRATGAVEVVNATGPAPRAATREAYLPDGIPMKGIRSVSVPGLVDGWLMAHGRYGQLKVSEAFAPAIDLAENGFPVSRKLAASIAAERTLLEYPTSRAVFAPEGRPLQAGEILYQRNLARTLARLAADGRDTFYRGEIAQAIVRCSKEHGGLLAPEDLAGYQARWQQPISTTYRSYEVYEAPPNSSGHVLLQELNLVELFDLRSLGCNTPASVHLMVEAKKLAFADREAYLADPDFVDVPVAGLLSKEYARERAGLIDPERAALVVAAGDPWRYQEGRPSAGPARRVTPSREDTTCFAVVDRWGNAVCQLQSLQSAFGSGLVAGDTGILLNNRMTYWHLDPEHVDCLQPGKRVRHTMNPVMVFRRGTDHHSQPLPREAGEGCRRRGDGLELVLVCGTPGADTQVQTNLQVITHVLDFGLTVAEAVEAPRWRHAQSPTESTVPHVCEDTLDLEGRFPAETRADLRRRGHPVREVGDWEGPGSEMMIQVSPATGALFGAADPRRDGYAIGW